MLLTQLLYATFSRQLTITGCWLVIVVVLTYSTWINNNIVSTICCLLLSRIVTALDLINEPISQSTSGVLSVTRQCLVYWIRIIVVAWHHRCCRAIILGYNNDLSVAENIYICKWQGTATERQKIRIKCRPAAVMQPANREYKTNSDQVKNMRCRCRIYYLRIMDRRSQMHPFTFTDYMPKSSESSFRVSNAKRYYV